MRRLIRGVPLVVLLPWLAVCTMPQPGPVPQPGPALLPKPAPAAAPGPQLPHAEPGSREAEPSRGPRRVTVAATGDVLLHTKVVRTGRRRGWDHVFDGLARVTRPGDITFANLEAPLAEDLVPVRTGSPPVLGAPAEVAPALAAAGVDVLGCANNHAYDQLAEGAARTLRAVHGSGIVAVGAGRDLDEAFAPRVVVESGVRVAFVAAAEWVNGGPGEWPPRVRVATLRDRDRLEEAVRRARADSDLVVAALHWGRDLESRPKPRHRELARELVEWGADLVIGTGPHVLHPVERVSSPRGEALIAYSLGNLVSNQGVRYRLGRRPPPSLHPALAHPGARDGVLLRVTAELDGGVRFAGVRAVGLWTHNNYWRQFRGHESAWDVHVRPLASIQGDLRRIRAESIAQALGDAVELVER